MCCNRCNLPDIQRCHKPGRERWGWDKPHNNLADCDAHQPGCKRARNSQWHHHFPQRRQPYRNPNSHSERASPPTLRGDIPTTFRPVRALILFCQVCNLY